ncbi:MAG TPA: hypothetical protein DDX93_05050 [Smithella sp.]|nr:hypothetical protein [Smithella sp.]
MGSSGLSRVARDASRPSNPRHRLAPLLNKMDKFNFDSLRIFDLTFPGHWLEGEDRNQAFQIAHVLQMIQDLFIEAVSSCALLRPLTSENIREYLERTETHKETPYERCLNAVYAKAFIFALDGIEKLMCRLVTNYSAPEKVKHLHEEYQKLFGHLKHMRDSAIHIEDRGRGKTRKQQPLKTHIVALGCFIERRCVFTGEDGKQYEIEISESTLKQVKSIIQAVINSYPWLEESKIIF